MKFHKYHGLGNDYIVINPKEFSHPLDAPTIELLCNRNLGIGSDGILYGPLDTTDSGFKLRIFNPNGSEAEKSGNGIRIFSRYLWDIRLVDKKPFQINTLGGIVTSQILHNGSQVRVEMGKVSFNAKDIPIMGKEGDVLRRELTVNNRTLTYSAATIGNPHCVILCDTISPELAKELGPQIESLPLFPKRTNVQFLKIIDPSNIQIEIWERGAGYTLASGSSSIAAAAVAHKLGFCGPKVEVHMRGGSLLVEFSDDYTATMIGPVVTVFDGELRDDFLRVKKRS